MALEFGDYLCNRWSLFRFGGFLPDAEGVLLEDCWSNGLVTYDLQTFDEMKLTKVDREREPIAHGDF